MKVLRPLSASLIAAAAFAGQSLAADAPLPAKVTYNDHVLPVFKNACLNCHNPDKKKAGLDLSTYQAALAGSDNGKVVESGNASASLLVKVCRQTEEPKMPPKGDKLSDNELALLEKWITGQLLETMTGKAVVASNNVQVAVVSLSRPDGPPPMPSTDLPLEPFVRTKTTNALVALAASPWAPLVAVGGQKQIILYNTATLQPLGILPFPEGFPAIIRFSRNGKLLMTGGGLGGKLGKVVLWDVQTGQRAGEVGNEFDQVLGADLSPDQTHVALGGPGKLLKIYSTKDGKLERSIKKHTDWITAVAYSPDGKFLASADRNGGISVWEAATGQEFNALPGHKSAVTALAFMPGVLASASEDGKISLWDVKEGKEIRSWAAHAGGASSVDFTTDGRLVSAGRDKLAKAWDQTGKVLLTTQPFEDIALRAVLSEDRLVAGDWMGNIRVFPLDGGGKPAGELSSNPPSIVESLAAAEKELAEITAAQKSTADAVAAAEKSLQEALAAAEKKRTDDIAAGEKGVKDALAEIEALKKAPEQAQAELKKAQAALEEATKKVAALPEAERGAEQTKINAQRQAVADLSAKASAADADSKAKLPTVERKQQETAAALAKLKSEPVKLPPSPDAVAQVEAATKNLEALRAEALRMTEAAKRNGNLPKQQPRIDAKNAEAAAAETVLTKAKANIAASPQELELARAKAAQELAKGKIDGAKIAVQRWQRAQAFMRVHNAKQSVADLQNKYEELVATAKDALSPIDQTAATIAAAEKTVTESPKLIAEKEAAFNIAKAAAEKAEKTLSEAESVVSEKEGLRKTATQLEAKLTAEIPETTKRQMAAKASEQRKEKQLEGLEKGSDAYVAAQNRIAALVKEAAETQTALDAANKTLAEAKQQQETLATEITKAKEVFDAARLEAKKSLAAKAAAEKAFTAAREGKVNAEKTLADLKPKTNEIAAAAKQAKTKAEQEAGAVAKQLETAKAEATRIRAEYDSRFPAPPTPQPIASK